MSANYDDIVHSYISAGPHGGTVDAFTAPIADAFVQQAQPADKIDFESAWRAVLRAARQSDDPQVSEKLASLLAQIKAKGELTRPDGTVCKHWAGVAWVDLPSLGAEMREQWNEAPPAMDSRQWANINAFAARLTTQGISDFSLFAVWAFRDALETERPLTRRETAAGEQLPSKPDEVPLDELLPAVLAWLEFCGPHLADLATSGRVYKQESQKNDPAHLGPLAASTNSGGGFDMVRWKFWRSRLEELSSAKDDAGGREKVAKLAYQGVQTFQTISK